MNDPGLYETYQKELTTLYLEFVDNHHVISNTIESIFVSVSTLNISWRSEYFFYI